ncbi:MAG: transglycosylase SLT domain-containing protein, partial [Nocardioidaceae bacterium]
GVKLYFGIHSPSKKFLSIGKDLIRGLLKGVAALAKRPIKALTTLGRKAVGVFKGSGHWLLSHGKSLVTGMKNGIHQFRKHPVDSLTRMGKAEVSVFSKAVSWLIPGGHQLVSGMKKGIRDFRQHPIDTLTSLGKSMRRVFTNAPDWLVHHGKQLISGLKSGINTAMDGIKKWLRHHVWGPITNGVKSLFGIHSPSSVFAGFGHNMIRGLIKGLIKSDPRAFVKKIFGGVSDSAVQALGWMVNHGQVALDKLGNLSSSVLSKLGGIGGAAVGKLKGLFGGGGGGGDTGSYSGVALQVLRMFGYGREWLPRLLHRMNVESGGNPGIVNKWDSNWQAGHPSVGLMQVIRGTFDAFAGPFRNLGPFKYGVSTNPLANIYAAVNYALSRYGVPAVGGTQGYDKGGWLPTGTSLVHNHTGRSEPTAVFTRTQWETLHALASGGSGGNFPRRLVLVTGQGQEFEAYMDDRVDLQLGQVTRAMAAG